MPADYVCYQVGRISAGMFSIVGKGTSIVRCVYLCSQIPSSHGYHGLCFIHISLAFSSDKDWWPWTL
jgi:hypothetical protein